MKHIYAIGLRGWVELREAEKPPRAITTRATKMIKERVRDWGSRSYFDSFYNVPPKWKTVQSELKIVNTVYEGGKVLNRIDANTFGNIARRYPPCYGQLIRLTPTLVNKLKERGHINAR